MPLSSSRPAPVLATQAPNPNIQGPKKSQGLKIPKMGRVTTFENSKLELLWMLELALNGSSQDFNFIPHVNHVPSFS
jgi:hypothetical protein